MTSEHTRLVVPDEQLRRLGYPNSYSNIYQDGFQNGFPSILIPKRRGRFFFFDEANISWCPESGRIYRISGTEYKVNTPGRNETKYILGSLEYPFCGGLYEIYSHKRNQEFRKHLEHLMEMYPDDYLFIYRDNASSHVTPMLDEFLLSNRDRLILVPSPTYSPNLNLIERLWHYMRDNITRSHFYITLDAKCLALIKWLETLPIQRFLSLVGLSP